jgi:hypothetical protein
MKVKQIVEKKQSHFTPNLKLAQDLAALLDGPVLTLPEDRSDCARLAKLRQEVFERFSALCRLALLPIPPLEPETVEAQLPRESPERREEAEALAAKAQSRLIGADGDEPLTDECRTLAKALRLMPGLLADFGGISRTGLTALINSRLMRLGLEPLRPDHAELAVETAADEEAPSQPLTVLVVDDEPEMIVRTILRLAGWPGLSLHALLIKGSWDQKPADTIGFAASAIVSVEPAVVLMDQGLGRVNGSAVIEEALRLCPELNTVFVGNTGGSPEELNAVGAIGNCNKGRDLSPVRRALRRWRPKDAKAETR